MTIDCDAWRAAYDTATPADQRRWHSEVWEQYPDQSHFSAEPMAAAIERVRPRMVVELGGWDGEAAITMLGRFPFIESWTNVEVCAEAVEHGWTHERYTSIAPDGEWYWDRTWTADLFVGAHVIEHLKMRDLANVIDATRAPVFYLEAPLFDKPTYWSGPYAMHIIEEGWDGITAMFERRQFKLIEARTIKTKPESGEISRWCLYAREGA